MTTAAPRNSNPRLARASSGALQRTIIEWYAAHARPLPWRDPRCSPWGVLLSEVMSQQTPVARVEPVWRDWLRRWPTPAALAAEPSGEVVRAWGRLGYPRRALRLHEAAGVIVSRYGGEVPRSEAELRALPGVGEYTAAAVAAFAFGERTVVVDTNVRRALARAVDGEAQASPSLTRAEMDRAAQLVPEGREDAALWNAGIMELGAVICTARSPQCSRCPVSKGCAWLDRGRPAYTGPTRKAQAWHGTDRQVRGAILQVLREAPGAVRREVLAAEHEETQFDRCLSGLIEDGLVEPSAREHYGLPGTAGDGAKEVAS